MDGSHEEDIVECEEDELIGVETIEQLIRLDIEPPEINIARRRQQQINASSKETL